GLGEIDSGQGRNRTTGTPIVRFAVSIAKILELQRDVGDGFLDELDRSLQVVLLCAGDAHRGALNARLHLQLVVLDQLDDFFGLLRLDAVLDLDRLLDGMNLPGKLADY